MTNAPAFLAALTRLFQEGHSLVFWNDPEGEFATQVDGIDIDGVEVLRLDRTPALQAKIRIERKAGVRWLMRTGSTLFGTTTSQSWRVMMTEGQTCLAKRKSKPQRPPCGSESSVAKSLAQTLCR